MSEIAERGPEQWDMEVVWMDPGDLVPNPDNPNEQDDRTFNALVASIQTEGWTVPVTAVFDQQRQKYEIVAGEHRWRAAQVLDCKVPVIVLPQEEFDRDRRDWNVVKDNMLRGKMNPERFATLYQRLVARYDAETLQALMGFTSEDAFRKIYREVERALPPGMAEALKATQDEIRTIDDLSIVLNRLFRDHGETLPSNMMVFSWAGKDVLWIRAHDSLWKIVTDVAKRTAEQKGDVAARMEEIIRAGLETLTERTPV